MEQDIQNLLRKRWVLPTATGVVGFVIGAVVGYMRTKYQYDQIEEKLNTLEEDQRQIDADTEVVLEAARIIESSQQLPLYLEDSEGNLISEEVEEKLEDLGKAVVSNIFSKKEKSNDGDEWDYKFEIETRNKAAPYVIHVDEYVADEMGWDSQTTLTWYEKDQILCDSHDRPIYNHGEVVGELRFGHGSNDANVVYVRNERLQAEYEVLRDEGSYEEIVLGEKMDQDSQTNDIRHSIVRKFRDD